MHRQDVMLYQGKVGSGCAVAELQRCCSHFEKQTALCRNYGYMSVGNVLLLYFVGHFNLSTCEDHQGQTYASLSNGTQS